MADGNTLVDFVVWAAQTYPSDRLVLILSDHGMGWPGGWSDPAPAARGDSSSSPRSWAISYTSMSWAPRCRPSASASTWTSSS